MAKAFPVGFVGLSLMMLGQLGVAVPISKLHTAASHATTRAVDYRSSVTLTTAEAVVASIKEAMKPVTTLGSTFSDHLEPVIASLGQRLEQSLSLIQTRFSDIDRSTARFSESTAALQKTAEALITSSTHLEGLLKGAPAVLDELAELQKRQRKAVDRLASDFDRDLEIAEQVAKSLEHVRIAAEGLPEQMLSKTAESVTSAFDHLASHAIQAWEIEVQTLASKLQGGFSEFVGRTSADIDDIHTSIRSAAQEWERLAGASQSLITSPLQTAINAMVAASSSVLLASREVVESISEVQEATSALPQQLMTQTSAALGPAFERLAAESLQTWTLLVNRFAQSLQADYTEYIDPISERFGQLAKNVEKATDEWRRLAQSSERLLTEPVLAAVATTKEQMSTLMIWVDDVVRERYPTVKRELDALSERLASATAALAATETRLREVNIDRREESQEIQVLRQILNAVEPKPQPPTARFLDRFLPQRLRRHS